MTMPLIEAALRPVDAAGVVAFTGIAVGGYAAVDAVTPTKTAPETAKLTASANSGALRLETTAPGLMRDSETVNPTAQSYDATSRRRRTRSCDCTANPARSAVASWSCSAVASWRFETSLPCGGAVAVS